MQWKNEELDKTALLRKKRKKENILINNIRNDTVLLIKIRVKNLEARVFLIIATKFAKDKNEMYSTYKILMKIEKSKTKSRKFN